MVQFEESKARIAELEERLSDYHEQAVFLTPIVDLRIVEIKV